MFFFSGCVIGLVVYVYVFVYVGVFLWVCGGGGVCVINGVGVCRSVVFVELGF